MKRPRGGCLAFAPMTICFAWCPSSVNAYPIRIVSQLGLSKSTASSPSHRNRGNRVPRWTVEDRKCTIHRSWQRKDWKRAKSSSSALRMALMPLPTDEVQRLIAVGAPTAIQYSTYWGRTAQEQYGRVLESAIVSFLGVSFSYFMSFVVGGFVATIFGSLFLFWGILSPELKAYQRNWEFLGGRELVDPWGVRESGRDPEDAGLYGALFLDATTYSYEYDLAEFADYNMNDDELEKYTGRPYLLRLLVADKSVNGQDRDDIGGGRELQVHARLSDEYLDVRRGMPVSGILLSTSPRFDRLAAITDMFVPDAGCWIGDYPYLNRAEVEDLLARDDEIWDLLQLESNLEIDSYDNQGTSRTETGIATENAGRDSGYDAGIKERFDVDDTFESFNAGSSWKNTEDGSSTWTSR